MKIKDLSDDQVRILAEWKDHESYPVVMEYINLMISDVKDGHALLINELTPEITSEQIYSLTISRAAQLRVYKKILKINEKILNELKRRQKREMETLPDSKS